MSEGKDINKKIEKAPEQKESKKAEQQRKRANLALDIKEAEKRSLKLKERLEKIEEKVYKPLETVKFEESLESNTDFEYLINTAGPSAISYYFLKNFKKHKVDEIFNVDFLDKYSKDGSREAKVMDSLRVLMTSDKRLAKEWREKNLDKFKSNTLSLIGASESLIKEIAGKAKEDSEGFWNLVKENPTTTALLVGAGALGLGYLYYSSNVEDPNSKWNKAKSTAMYVGVPALALLGVGKLLDTETAREWLMKEFDFDPLDNRFSEALIDFSNFRFKEGMYTLFWEGPNENRELHRSISEQAKVDPVIVRMIGDMDFEKVINTPLSKTFLPFPDYKEYIPYYGEYLEDERNYRKLLRDYVDFADAGMKVDQVMLTEGAQKKLSRVTTFTKPAETPEGEVERQSGEAKKEKVKAEVASIQKEVKENGQWTKESREKYESLLEDANTEYEKLLKASPGFVDRAMAAWSKNFDSAFPLSMVADEDRVLYEQVKSDLMIEYKARAKDIDKGAEVYLAQQMEKFHSIEKFPIGKKLNSAELAQVESVMKELEDFLIDVEDIKTNINKKAEDDKSKDKSGTRNGEGFVGSATEFAQDAVEFGELGMYMLPVLTLWDIPMHAYISYEEGDILKTGVFVAASVPVVKGSVKGAISGAKFGSKIGGIRGGIAGLVQGTAVGGPAEVVKKSYRGANNLAKFMLGRSLDVAIGSPYKAFMEGDISFKALEKYTDGKALRSAKAREIAFMLDDSKVTYEQIAKALKATNPNERQVRILNTMMNERYGFLDKRKFSMLRYRTSELDTGAKILSRIKDEPKLSAFFLRNNGNRYVEYLFKERIRDIGTNIDELLDFIKLYEKHGDELLKILEAEDGKVLKHLAKNPKGAKEILFVSDDLLNYLRGGEYTDELINVGKLLKKYPKLFRGVDGEMIRFAAESNPLVYDIVKKHGKILSEAEDGRMLLLKAIQEGDETLKAFMEFLEKASKTSGSTSKGVSVFSRMFSKLKRMYALTQTRKAKVAFRSGGALLSVLGMVMVGKDFINAFDEYDEFDEETQQSVIRAIEDFQMYKAGEFAVEAMIFGELAYGAYMAYTGVTVATASAVVLIPVAGVLVGTGLMMEHTKEAQKAWARNAKQWKKMAEDSPEEFYEKFKEMGSNEVATTDQILGVFADNLIEDAKDSNTKAKKEMYAGLISKYGVVGYEKDRLEDMRYKESMDQEYITAALNYIGLKTDGTFDFDPKKSPKLLKEALNYAALRIMTLINEDMKVKVDGKEVSAKNITDVRYLDPSNPAYSEQLKINLNAEKFLAEKQEALLDDRLIDLITFNPADSKVIEKYVAVVVSRSRYQIDYDLFKFTSMLDSEAGATTYDKAKFIKAYYNKVGKIATTKWKDYLEFGKGKTDEMRLEKLRDLTISAETEIYDLSIAMSRALEDAESSKIYTTISGDIEQGEFENIMNNYLN